MVPQTLDKVYEKAQNFVNLEREPRQVNKTRIVVEASLKGKGKKGISLDKVNTTNMSSNKIFVNLPFKMGNTWNINLRL